MSKEDIQVDLTGSTLTIKGEKKSEEETKEEDYCCCQRSYGSFSRSIELPAEVKVGSGRGIVQERDPGNPLA